TPAASWKRPAWRPRSRPPRRTPARPGRRAGFRLPLGGGPRRVELLEVRPLERVQTLLVEPQLLGRLEPGFLGRVAVARLLRRPRHVEEAQSGRRLLHRVLKRLARVIVPAEYHVHARLSVEEVTRRPGDLDRLVDQLQRFLPLVLVDRQKPGEVVQRQDV